METRTNLAKYLHQNLLRRLNERLLTEISTDEVAFIIYIAYSDSTRKLMTNLLSFLEEVDQKNTIETHEGASC